MRYFVVMQDGVIKPATNVSNIKSTGRVHFEVDGELYRYLIFTYDCEHYMCKRITIPTSSFQQFKHEEWFNTVQIKCLIYFNEEENEELNYFQSTDFNAGMLYSGVEKSACELLKDKGILSVSSNYSIPTIQLIPNNCYSINEAETIKATIKAATDHFEAVYGKNLKLNIYDWQQHKQYHLFCYTISRKETCKEMTIADIEEALGYKIKVVSDK